MGDSHLCESHLFVIMRKFSIYDLRGEMGRNNNSKSLHNKKNDTNFIRLRFFCLSLCYSSLTPLMSSFRLLKKTRIQLCTDRQMNREQKNKKTKKKLYKHQHVSE